MGSYVLDFSDIDKTMLPAAGGKGLIWENYRGLRVYGYRQVFALPRQRIKNN
jgi:hypothetical protein